MKYPLTLTFFLASLVFVLYMTCTSLDDPLNGETVDCYDSYHNKIIGDTCVIRNSYDTEGDRILFLSCAGAIVISVLTGLGYFLDISDDSISSKREGSNA